jgi:hypothetical protein
VCARRHALASCSDEKVAIVILIPCGLALRDREWLLNDRQIQNPYAQSFR